MKLVAVTGRNGAGKGAVVDYLETSHGFTHLSVSNYLVELLQKRGLEINRLEMINLANELRSEYGPEVLFKRLYERATEQGLEKVIIESLRCPGEAHYIKALQEYSVDSRLIAVDADESLRFERCVSRGSEKDQNLTKAEFLNKEALEASSDDPAKQNLLECQRLADVVVYNNGSFEELYAEIEDRLGDFLEL